MDPLDKAIAAAGEEPPVRLQMLGTRGLLSPGRPVVVEYPADMTDAELVQFGSWMLGAVQRALAERRSPVSRLVLPGH